MKHKTVQYIIANYNITYPILCELILGKRKTKYNRVTKRQDVISREEPFFIAGIDYEKVNSTQRNSPKLFTDNGIAKIEKRYGKRNIENN